MSGLERDARVLPGCECPVVLPVTPVTVVAGSGGVVPSPKLCFEGYETTRSPLKGSPSPVAYGTLSDAEAQNNMHTPPLCRGRWW